MVGFSSLKDKISAKGGNEKFISSILGEGIINTRKVVNPATKNGGIECYVIEQESD
jgi:hypothetical protein